VHALSGQEARGLFYKIQGMLFTALQIISVGIIVFIIYSFFRKKKKQKISGLINPGELLSRHVVFYQQLESTEKTRFQNAVLLFLETVRITGVNTDVEDLDRVLIASAAIIPIFAFKGWMYGNIHEVLLYPGSFDHEYKIEGEGRNILGMVGTGAMQHMMILSKQELRNDFANPTSKSNTGIHEFVHLLDKTDGVTDGLPEALLPHRYSLPWLHMIREEMSKMEKGESDINTYGLTNNAEFFAVVSEYFFTQPELLKEKHPELYQMLTKVFDRKDAAS
jgi:Mlc titration factor MtfA (ptsG expression regulator)